MSNLEPIEEKDTDLEKKFKGGMPEKLEAVKEEPAVFKKEKEALRETSAAEKEDAYAKILARVKQPAAGALSDEEIKEDAGKVYQKTDAESQIQHLVDLALAKGVVHAVKVARHMEDNYVLDMFHDKLLADELYGALVKKGLIQEI